MINFISQIIIDSGNRDFSPTIIIIIQQQQLPSTMIMTLLIGHRHFEIQEIRVEMN